ncbi:MAG: adenylate/guanylate cyclase domain-containing protein [Roseobacter sp.]
MPEGATKILITDDNKVNRLLLSRSVEMLGYSAQSAENGRIAMDRLRQERFDLLLLDIEMPEMDGFEVLEALKADPALRDLPVIVTSSVEGVANVVRCIELGAEDYLAKPVQQVLLKARLSSSLEKKRLRDQQKELLEKFATTEVAQDLQSSGFALGGRRVDASILFCDIRGFTTISESQSPEETIELLNIYYTLMFEAIDSNGGIVTLMVGDGLMAVFGAPRPLEAPALSAVLAAQDMLLMMAQFNQERTAQDRPEVNIGVGIASGDVVAGYAGTQQRATYTCIGDKVNLAARLEAHTKIAGRAILMDAKTHGALEGGLACDAIGAVEFKGFSKPVDVFAVSGE